MVSKVNWEKEVWDRVFEKPCWLCGGYHSQDPTYAGQVQCPHCKRNVTVKYTPHCPGGVSHQENTQCPLCRFRMSVVVYYDGEISAQR